MLENKSDKLPNELLNELVDVHAHLDHPLLIDRTNEIISRAKKLGLKWILSNGLNPQTNRSSLELSEKYLIVKCAMGLYPGSTLKSDFDIDKEISYIRENKDKLVAIGEVGLDFVDGQDTKQIEDFKKMIEIAEELKKPIIVHSRKAEEKCIEVLESYSSKKVIMHCFCGRKSLVKRVMDNGWFLSIPTIVVRSQQFQEMAKHIPTNQLFCETDSPYLSPYKGQCNEPGFVIESYKKIAELKKMSIEEVVHNIFMNWKNIFDV